MWWRVFLLCFVLGWFVALFSLFLFSFEKRAAEWHFVSFSLL